MSGLPHGWGISSRVHRRRSFTVVQRLRFSRLGASKHIRRTVPAVLERAAPSPRAGKKNLRPGVAMISPPLCVRCRGKHPASENCPEYPRVVFTKSPKALPSDTRTIRFAVLPARQEIVEIVGDWWQQPFELTAEAAQNIFGFVETTKAAVSAGGGRSYLRLRVRESVAEGVKQHVGSVLASPKSWRRLTYRAKFEKDEVHVFGNNSKYEGNEQ